ncbi:glycoside hydrolase family 18 protein [Sphaerobolus stellatus SS14]|nr:glycoside hydrolase family 18 protein [Sphaerobolus stellatus SS14]
MATVKSVSITGHTTTSSPRPHILYSVEVLSKDGHKYTLSRRYSEFDALRDSLGCNSGSLPPKRILTTTFIPAAWVDDNLITERKAGLQTYLRGVLKSEDACNHPAMAEFLAASPRRRKTLSLEDVLPSTLSKKDVERIGATRSNLVAAAYYPDWSVYSVPPESIDFSKFDLLYFAFVVPNSSCGLSWDGGSQSTLQRLVTSAKNSGYGTKVALSVGGWGGCAYFSNAVSNSANRTTFVQACVDAVKTYNLDGIDIDWEYPNSAGAGNAYSSSDAANLLSLFKALRLALGSSKIISAAVSHLPWLGPNGSPLTDVSAYAAQLTTVNIMNYDVNGASGNPGPNAPLSDACHKSKQPQANAAAALAQWTAAGFPTNKLLLGLPLYGYVSRSTKTALSDFMDSSVALEEAFHVPEHAHSRPCLDTSKKIDAEALAAGDLSAYMGQQIAFKDLLRLGALKKLSNGTYGQANGYTEGWDDCSDTPFLFNVSRSTVVTYDDTYSLGDKALFARQNGMAGCFTWSLDQDDGVSLQSAIRQQLGK